MAPTTNFSFPYLPYSIQDDLMQHVFDSLSASKVTVVESPTGTGKSLSLICSSLTYLSHASSLAREELVASIRAQVAESSSADEPAWVVEQAIEMELLKRDASEKELEERLEAIRRKEKEEGGRARKRAKLGAKAAAKAGVADEEYAPDPYDSDADENAPAAEGAADNYTQAVREGIQRRAAGRTSTSQEHEEPDVRKIYYASRTHSQLSQFVAEVRKTTFAGFSDPSLQPSASTWPSPAKSTSTPTRPVRVISLGSRAQLCINDEVRSRSHGSSEAFGDLCLDLQKSAEKRCKFLPPVGEPAKMTTFRDRALTEVHDIEDIEDLGRKLHTCPYYGSRRAVQSAELVTLPYNMLMQKSTREALGISLKDNVVIIDEAHNLISSLLSLHSVSISLSSLRQIRTALQTYYTRFKSRFKGSNAMYLKQLLIVLKALSTFSEEWAKGAGPDGGGKKKMMDVNAFVGGLKGGAIDQVNFLKLDTYLKNSKIASKIGGYVDSLAEDIAAKGRPAIRSNATRQFHLLQTFLVALTNAEKAGRILLNAEQSAKKAGEVDVTLTFMLLSPSEAFRDVAEEARSVVLAGGTMKPMSDFREQLFPYLPADRFSTFSCGHIVPPEQIITFAVGKGPSGKEMTFTFSTRKDETLVDELGNAIFNIASIVPRGIVVFTPSYAFLDQLQARWTKSGLLERMGKRKKTFWEPKASGDVESTLREYSLANSGAETGGIMFAVVDAKLSEGINFADDMARAVIICGIPYPNVNSPEVKERMSYLNSLPRLNPRGPTPGDVLYQNMAFRGVNQSIGRAIRHKGDWAAIILLDSRYTRSEKQAQLPDWLGHDVQKPAKFGELLSGLGQFCRRLKASPPARST